MMEFLGRVEVSCRTGREPFRDGARELGFDLLGFWQWSGSDLVSNALRGRLAEFLVAQALGLASGVRSEWDAYDLRLPNGGPSIEVKSSAYLQTWAQKAPSAICFTVRPTRAWNADTNELAGEGERRRQADLYVFAVLHHRDKTSLDPLDVAQWEFYVLPARVLNARLPTQKQLSLASLLKLGPAYCRYAELRSAVERFGTLPEAAV